MGATELDKDKAVARLVRLARSHPNEVQRAGRCLWTEIQAEIEAIVHPKVESVQRQRAAAKEARRVVLDPTHRVPREITRNPFWKVYISLFAAHRASLESMDDEQVLEILVQGLAERSFELEREQARHLPSQPGRGHDLAYHAERGRAQHFDLEGASRTGLGPPFFISKLLRAAVRIRATTYTLEEYWRLAALYLLVESLEVPATDLGFPMELRIGKNETTPGETFNCRDLCRAYLADGAEDVPEGYLELACRVAVRLGAAAKRTQSGETKAPLSEPKKSAFIDLVDAAEKYEIPPDTLHGWKKRHTSVLKPRKNPTTGRVVLNEYELYRLLKAKKRL